MNNPLQTISDAIQVLDVTNLNEHHTVILSVDTSSLPKDQIQSFLENCKKELRRFVKAPINIAIIPKDLITISVKEKD